MTDSETPCELCGFDTSLYGLESDLTSTVRMAPHVVAAATEGLGPDELHAPVSGTSISELVESVGRFEGDDLATAHNGLHTMAQIGALRAELGHGPVEGTGQVTGLHSSSGGVPKTPVKSGEITRSGLVGDVQNNRIHHGRPLQAICLWSADIIDALNNQGHPVCAGLAGENITVDGVDWASLRPGSRIQIGDVPMLISAYATPCSKIADGFAERAFSRVDHDDHPGWSRLYAIPLAEGTLAVGDAVSVG